MKEPTKEILTRQSIREALERKHRKSMLYTVCLSALFSLVLIPFVTLLLIWALSESHATAWPLISAIAAALIGLFPIGLMVYILWDVFGEHRRLAQDDFEIVTAELSYKSEKYVNRQWMELLHFAGSDRPVQVGHTAYQLASAGDLYYLVYYRGRNAVKLFYACKMYEYTEQIADGTKKQ